MKLVYSIWVWLLLLVPVESFKILVWPAEWSHWINMKVKILKVKRASKRYKTSLHNHQSGATYHDQLGKTY